MYTAWRCAWCARYSSLAVVTNEALIIRCTRGLLLRKVPVIHRSRPSPLLAVVGHRGRRDHATCRHSPRKKEAVAARPTKLDGPRVVLCRSRSRSRNRRRTIVSLSSCAQHYNLRRLVARFSQARAAPRFRSGSGSAPAGSSSSLTPCPGIAPLAAGCRRLTWDVGVLCNRGRLGIASGACIRSPSGCSPAACPRIGGSRTLAQTQTLKARLRHHIPLRWLRCWRSCGRTVLTKA